MKIKSTLVAAAAAALLSAGVALAAGLFPNLPIVGRASYCGGFSTGVSGQVCTTTVPAGPTQITGNETIPADTNLPQGQAPQTVLLSMASINALPYQYANPVNAGTTTVLPTTGKLILQPAGTLTTTTIALPAATALVDGQTLEFNSTATLTAIVFAPGTGTIMLNTPSALTVSNTQSTGYKLIFTKNNTNNTGVWYRLQ